MCTPNLLIYLSTFFRRSNILVLLHFKIHDILLCTSAVLGAVLERPKSVCMGIAKIHLVAARGPVLPPIINLHDDNKLDHGGVYAVLKSGARVPRLAQLE